MKTLLYLTSIGEILVGIVFVLFPATFIRLILGVESNEVIDVTYVFVGIALICFGVACFPSIELTGRYFKIPSVRAMLMYNLFATVYFLYLKFADGFNGILILPVAIIHGLITILYLVLILKQKNVQ